MTTLFTYLITHDGGAAPNPFWGVCTLVVCKPAIRRAVKVGDWVVGMGAKGMLVTDYEVADMTGRVVYAMRVTSKLTMAEYDAYASKELPKKIPKWVDRDWRRRVSDCLYDFSTDPPTQRKGVHGPKDAERDLSGGYALLSTDFVYFGDRAVRLPDRLRPILPKTQGHRSRSNDPHVDVFVAWLRGLGHAPRSVLGEPTFRKFRGSTQGTGLNCGGARREGTC